MFKALACWIAYRLPVEVIYYAAVRAWLAVTFGNWPDGEWELSSLFSMSNEPPEALIDLGRVGSNGK